MLAGGLESHHTTELILCGTGILPVLDNGAKYKLQLTWKKESCLIDFKKGMILNKLAS